MPFLISKWPSRSQWGQFFKILSRREKGVFFSFLLLTLASLIFLAGSFYLANTEIQPAKSGS